MNSPYSNIKSAPADRNTAGPFDAAERSSLENYVDFGSILVPQHPDLTIKLEVEESSSRILAVSLEFMGSTVQLQAFAAPKSEGLWHEIRFQLSESITQQGGSVSEQSGSLGPELIASLSVTDNSGAVIGNKQVRFVGVDGPRWFLRAVVSGAAITDSQALADVDDLIRAVVVRRGTDPIPPRDLLMLSTPNGKLSNSRAVV